jgi:hypothetical protein
MEPEGSLPWSQGPPIPRPCVTFRNKLFFYGEEFLAPRPYTKLKDPALAAGNPAVASSDLCFNCCSDITPKSTFSPLSIPQK